MSFVAPENGTFIFHFEFPSNGSGFFNAASVKGDSAIASPNGTAGTPNAPKQLSTTASNPLHAEEFYNYFRFTIEAGKKLVINTQLSQPLSAQQKTRCAASGGRGSTPTSLDTQVHVYNALYERVDGVCGENLTFIAPATGTYILHFSFGAQSAGEFYADSPSTNTPSSVVSSSASSVVNSVVSTLSSSSISSSSSSLSSAGSSVINSSSSSLNNSLPFGAGTFSTRFVVGGTYLIDETTGVLAPQPATLEKNYSAADINPYGVVIAVSSNGTAVDEIDLIKGTARTLFNAPEELSAIAVASDGIIVCISKNSEFKKHQVYRFNNTGTVLSKVAIEYSAHGIDFDKNDALYAVNLFGLYQLNPVSGASQLVSSAPWGQSDIDIDNENVLRLITSSDLKRFSVSDGVLLGSTVLQFDYFSFSPLVHR